MIKITKVNVKSSRHRHSHTQQKYTYITGKRILTNQLSIQTLNIKASFQMTPVKYKVDYAFLIDSGQVLYHMKYLIWG